MVGVIFNRSEKFKRFGLQGDSPPQKKFFFLAGHPDLPKGKTLRKVLDQLTVMILKRVSENISFQYIYSKFRDIKEVANSLIWHSIY